MNRLRAVRLFLFVMALGCIWWSWTPSKASLVEEPAQVVSVRPHLSWAEVELTTASGARLFCSNKQWSKTCPLEPFQRAQAARTPITVWHKAGVPYEVVANNGEIIVPYSSHRARQMLFVAVAVAFVVLAVAIGRK